MAHVAEQKKKVVEKIVELMKDYPIVGAVNMENLPAPQLQKMRETLRKDVVFLMTKRRLMNIAIDQVKDDKKGIEKLREKLVGMPALLFTKENPFKLYKIIDKNKSKAPAKGGQTAPNDIVIEAGATPFAPGPIIGELGALGLKTGVEDGKVAIKEDKVVVKEGEVIQPKAAELLTRLGIEPMEVGLNLVAVYENGDIFGKDVLGYDEEEFIGEIQSAIGHVFSLSVEAGIITDQNLDFLMQKIYREVRAVALEAEILTDDVMDDLIAKANNEANVLQQEAGIEIVEKKEVAKVDDAPKEEKKEEAKPAEEKPKEVVEEKEVAKVDDAPKEVAKVEEKPKEVKKVEEKPKEVAKTTDDKVTEMVKKAKEKVEEKPKEVVAEKKEEKKTTDDKIAEMVKKAKDKAEGNIPSADDLVKGVEKERENAEKIVQQIQKGEKISLEKDDRVPTALELAKKKKKS